MGTKGGILLAWSDSFTELQSLVNEFSVTIILSRGVFKFMLTVVYGPQEDDNKLRFLAELRLIRFQNDLPWIIIGDFNLIRTNEETTGVPRSMSIMREFNNFISDVSLLDIPLTGRNFTWSNKRPIPTFSRLDRALISTHWINLGSTANFRDAAATTSDHPPLILTLKPHDHSFKRTFKFENFWLSHSDIHGIVRQAWESVPQYTNSAKRFLTKIKSTQTALTKWAQLKFRNKDNFLTRSTWAIQQLDRVEE